MEFFARLNERAGGELSNIWVVGIVSTYKIFPTEKLGLLLRCKYVGL